MRRLSASTVRSWAVIAGEIARLAGTPMGPGGPELSEAEKKFVAYVELRLSLAGATGDDELGGLILCSRGLTDRNDRSDMNDLQTATDDEAPNPSAELGSCNPAGAGRSR